MGGADILGYSALLILLSLGILVDLVCYSWVFARPHLSAARRRRLHDTLMKAFSRDPMLRSWYGAAGDAVFEKCVSTQFNALLDYAPEANLITVDNDLGVLIFDVNYLYFCRALRLMMPLFFRGQLNPFTVLWKAWVLGRFQLKVDWVKWKKGCPSETVIEAIAIHPDAQGHGAGTRLLEAYFKRKGDTARALVSSNPRNLTFYQRNGYEILDTLLCDGDRFTWMYSHIPEGSKQH